MGPILPKNKGSSAAPFTDLIVDLGNSRPIQWINGSRGGIRLERPSGQH